MHIFNSTASDPMLLDTVEGLQVLYSSFNAFLVSDEAHTSFKAATADNPAPYDEFLQGLRVKKVGSVS